MEQNSIKQLRLLAGMARMNHEVHDSKTNITSNTTNHSTNGTKTNNSSSQIFNKHNNATNVSHVDLDKKHNATIVRPNHNFNGTNADKVNKEHNGPPNAAKDDNGVKSQNGTNVTSAFDGKKDHNVTKGYNGTHNGSSKPPSEYYTDLRTIVY